MKSELIIPFVKPETLRDLLHLLQGELATCEDHPATSDYRRGYESALRNMRDNLALWLPANAFPCGTPKAS